MDVSRTTSMIRRRACSALRAPDTPKFLRAVHPELAVVRESVRAAIRSPQATRPCSACSGRSARRPRVAMMPNGTGALVRWTSSSTNRVLCSGLTDQPDKARGGLPRFFLDNLPSLEGMLATVEGDEFLHMVRVLRLKEMDRVELFDGRGGIVSGQLMHITRTAAEVATVENMRTISPLMPHWHVAAAFCALKGGRGEWLVEKCTELGARTLTPLLTQRSSSVSGGRMDRWRRIAMAATKQCQRLHNLNIQEPTALDSFLPKVSQAEVAFVASAEAPPLSDSLGSVTAVPQSGILFVGPEGDFTADELNSLIGAGARPVGLGPRRLRVETATIAMLAAVMLTVR